MEEALKMIQTSATWKKEGDKIYWVEERTEGLKHIILSKKEPLDANLGLTKSHVFKILLMDTEKISRFKDKKTFWVYECSMLIREEDEFIFLKVEKGVPYIYDVWNLQCFPAPLKSTPNLVVKLSEPVEISKSEAIEISKETGTMLFDAVEDNGDFGKQVTLKD